MSRRTLALLSFATPLLITYAAWAQTDPGAGQTTALTLLGLLTLAIAIYLSIVIIWPERF